MDHLAHLDLIRIHQDDLRRAAEQHRLVAAVRRSARPRRLSVTRLFARFARPSLARPHGGVEAEPCPP